jgi:hypothetical protein
MHPVRGSISRTASLSQFVSKLLSVRGVGREVESEGSRRQNAGLTNRNRKLGDYVGDGHYRLKPNTYTENVGVDAAGPSVNSGQAPAGRNARNTRGDLEIRYILATVIVR